MIVSLWSKSLNQYVLCGQAASATCVCSDQVPYIPLVFYLQVCYLYDKQHSPSLCVSCRKRKTRSRHSLLRMWTHHLYIHPFGQIFVTLAILAARNVEKCGFSFGAICPAKIQQVLSYLKENRGLILEYN